MNTDRKLIGFKKGYLILEKITNLEDIDVYDNIVFMKGNRILKPWTYERRYLDTRPDLYTHIAKVVWYHNIDPFDYVVCLDSEYYPVFIDLVNDKYYA